MRDGTEDRIFLTFDDGPDPIWTPRILEALHRSHARATFFVISPLALRFSHLVRRMIRAGHGVELHCMEHIRHTELTHAEVEADARGGLEDLNALGVRPRLWRPPCGVSTPRTQAVARDLRLELVSWNLDHPRLARRQRIGDVHPYERRSSTRGRDPHARRARSGRQALGLRRDRRPYRTDRHAPAFSRLRTVPGRRFLRRARERMRASDPLGTAACIDAATRAPTATGLESILLRIASGAAERDARPAFPEGPLRDLAASGVLAMAAPDPHDGSKRRSSFAEEWRVLRAVSRADGSVGRILDGHFNGVERVSVLAPEPLRSRELAAVAAGRLRLGVWGADPIPGEGTPARLVATGGGYSLQGVKTFCSGATGLDRALVAVRAPAGEPPGPPQLAYVDLSEGLEIDDGWFNASGMRSSESHRVVFEGAPVLGEPGELVREPYFGRDAIRTAVAWAGISDSAVEGALGILAAKSQGRPLDDLASQAAGRMLASRETIDRWLEHAASFVDTNPEASTAHFSTQLRESIAAARDILDLAARAVGSHPFATASDLDRARRDLELFLLQHRLEPALARIGRRAIEQREVRA